VAGCAVRLTWGWVLGGVGVGVGAEGGVVVCVEADGCFGGGEGVEVFAGGVLVR